MPCLNSVHGRIPGTAEPATMSIGSNFQNVDRISALPDDLLHVILTRLRTALDVTRTAALSRRWRRVWVHARALSLLFADPERRDKGTTEESFAGFVDWVLAQRGDADMDSLHISMKQAFDHPAPDKINEWIRYGTERVAGDFYLCAPLRPVDFHGQGDIELPAGHGSRAGSISLHLPFHGLRFPPPAAARYEALTALTLNDVSFAEDKQARGLCDFVSSCCPRLRTLVMEATWELTQLVLRVEALQELQVSFAPSLLTLDVTAPNLRVFSLMFCTEFELARIVAPRLQEIGMWRIRYYDNSRSDLDIHGLASVRRLSKIHLDVHAHHYSCDTGVDFELLEKCPGVQDVKLNLRHDAVEDLTTDDFADLTSECSARFPNVRSMVLEAYFVPERHLVASISSVLLRFPRLRSLCIKITKTNRGVLQCFCCQLGMCYDHGKSSLEFLEEVEVSGFTGADEEMDLVTLIFKISPIVRRMTLHANSEMLHSGDSRGPEDEIGDDSLEPMHVKLMDICSSGRGRWHFRKSVCTWGVLPNRSEHIAGTRFLGDG